MFDNASQGLLALLMFLIVPPIAVGLLSIPLLILVEILGYIAEPHTRHPPIEYVDISIDTIIDKPPS